TVEREGRAHAELERRAVEDGQRARMAEADGTDLRVGGRSELDGARAEELRPRLELDVGLDAGDEFVVDHGVSLFEIPQYSVDHVFYHGQHPLVHLFVRHLDEPFEPGAGLRGGKTLDGPAERAVQL